MIKPHRAILSALIFLILVSVLQVMSAQADGAVTILDGRLTFTPPSGFKRLSPNEIRVKYPNGTTPPVYAFADKNVDTSIAVNLLQTEMLYNQLPEIHQGMIAGLPEQIPGLRWIRRDIKTINNITWGVLEFLSKVPDGDAHNIMLLTSFDGQLLLFNFSSSTEEFKKVENDLLMSIFSIKRSQPATLQDTKKNPPSVFHDPTMPAETVIFKLESLKSVTNGPVNKTVFTISKPTVITKIWTYHWNAARGDNPGAFALKNLDTGTESGPWQSVGTQSMFSAIPGDIWPEQGDGPPYFYWTAMPGIVLEPGNYQLLDSSPETWSTNHEAGGRGMAWVYGRLQ